jgi:hypothetical protein
MTRITMERHLDVRRHSTWTADVPDEMIKDPQFFDDGRATSRFDQWMCDNGKESRVTDDVCDEDNLSFDVTDFD